VEKFMQDQQGFAMQNGSNRFDVPPLQQSEGVEHIHLYVDDCSDVQFARL
jgi:hypothetical protein